MKTLALFGSTGSIGQNVCTVVRQFPDQFRLFALAAGRNIELLTAQVLEFRPAWVCVAEKESVSALARFLPAEYGKKILVGQEGLCQLATLAEVDMVVSAVVGAVGLLPTLSAIRAGKNIGLANKETLVMAGRLVMAEAQQHGSTIFPIDSEHSALFQALAAGRPQDVKRLILTASGGPFRCHSLESLSHVSVAEALAHPNWSMGRKISIDSATLMNKGLEVIEAKWLFAMAPEQIEVVVHPQSIVHSLVEYVDGSVVAQLGLPDMCIPIAYALSYPERMPLKLPRLDLTTCGPLEFSSPDHYRFPALKLAFAALQAGGVHPAVLNAANEVAVAAFLGGKISFTQITAIVSQTLEKSVSASDLHLDDIVAADSEARSQAAELVCASVGK